LKEKLKEINTYIYDMNRSSLINIFLDSDLVAAGSSDLIFMVSYDSLIDSVKRNYWLILEIIESYFNKKFNFIFITVDEWNICKNDFISNKNDGIKYEYKNLVIEKTNEVFNNNKENEEKIIEHQKDNVIDLFGEVIEFE
ncbi:MAG: hypothetical protein PHQ64_00415, partial [Bacilli bacterium]|nr:hypothetical protein [Bacilli bacterium]